MGPPIGTYSPVLSNGRQLPQCLITLIGHVEIPIAIHRNASGMPESRRGECGLRSHPIPVSALAQGSRKRGDHAGGGYLPDGVVHGVGHQEVTLAVDDQATRRVEPSHAVGPVGGTGNRRRVVCAWQIAGQRIQAVGTINPDGIVASIGNIDRAVKANRQPLRAVEECRRPIAETGISAPCQGSDHSICVQAPKRVLVDKIDRHPIQSGGAGHGRHGCHGSGRVVAVRNGSCVSDDDAEEPVCEGVEIGRVAVVNRKAVIGVKHGQATQDGICETSHRIPILVAHRYPKIGIWRIRVGGDQIIQEHVQVIAAPYNELEAAIEVVLPEPNGVFDAELGVCVCTDRPCPRIGQHTIEQLQAEAIV